MPLRLIFMGTPEFAVPTLVEMVGRGHEVVAVYTRAPKRAGRGMDLQETPIAREARRFGVAVHAPATLRTPEAADAFAALAQNAGSGRAALARLDEAALFGKRGIRERGWQHG